MPRISLIAILGVAALCLHAQEGQELTTLKGVVRKGRAPVSNDVLRVKLPATVETKLKNGLSVVVLEDHRAPTVSLELSIPASPLADPPALPGLADATADMLRLGTKTYNSRQIVEALAEMGASLNTQAGSASRYTRITVSTLVENLDAVLELLAGVLLQPAFPQEELDKWKARQLSALQQMRTQPQFLANERMYQILYPEDARRLTAPTPDSVKNLTRQHLVDYYAAHYTPLGSVAGVAGDVTSKQITGKLEKYLGAWKGPEVESPKLALHAPIEKGKVVLIHRPGSVQTYLMVANRAIDRTSPDYYASAVMNRVLGQGPAARLFRNLREEKG
ncbi:MAG: insulinase family protein, partial [Acidobacteriia bacterium]|nr:insulinase family protein [Terriglobia bacterium]